MQYANGSDLLELIKGQHQLGADVKNCKLRNNKYVRKIVKVID